MITRIPGLLYGGDYNAEQWPEEVWHEDVRLMKEAGVNLVTVGVFSWARLQPSEGVFEFGWLDRLLDLLHAGGVGVDLATATASPPAWLVRAEPSILPVTADGVRLEFGSRQHYCPSSPIYRSASVRLARALASRYHDHPALALWHVHNEYGDHVTECFCDVSAADFRRWLGSKYSSLGDLNFAWGTEFWAQRYGTFEEIEPPRTAPGPVNPTQVLDWRRFCSDALLACYQGEKAVLDEVSPGVPVTTNFMSMFKPLDYWTWASAEDVVSDDAYPDPADPSAHVGAAMNYDLMRSLKRKPWLLLEQAPSAVSWRPVNVPKRPGLHRLWSLQTLARGADGVMYFQWRASRAGAEKFHSALVPHRGTSSRGWAETVRFGGELARLAAVAGSSVAAEVAIVLDWESWWALELDDHPSQRLKLKDIVLSWYSALYARNVTVDFVPPGGDLSSYRLVLAPNLYLVRKTTADWLAAYDGHLVCGFFSGIVDEHDHIHHPLDDLLGVVVDEVWPIPDGEVAETSAGPASVWSEWLSPTTASTVATYDSGPLAGRPAITRNDRAWYVSCHLDIGPVLDQVIAAAGVRPAAEVPAGVEAVRRGDHLFLLNHTDDDVSIDLPGTDLLTGATTPLTLAPLGAAVLREV